MPIIYDTLKVYEFLKTQGVDVPLNTSMKGIGFEQDGCLVAGVIYEGWNGWNVWMHVAAKAQSLGGARRFIRYAFEYPFDEWGAKRVSGYVNADNSKAIRLDEHLGFKRTNTLEGFGPNGQSIFIYSMTREECRYVANS